MKNVFLFVVFFVTVSFAAVDLRKPIAELKLADGRTLRAVEIISYAPSAVMAKWDGGRGTIPYDQFPGEYKEQLATMRPKPPARTATPAAQKAAEPVRKPAVQTPAAQRKLSGQVYVITKGAGAYKMAGVKLLAFPSAEFEEIARTQNVYAPSKGGPNPTDYANRLRESWGRALDGKTPLASATTDADGKYSMAIAGDGSLVIFCMASRLAGNGERYIWAVPSSGSGELNLENSNMRDVF